MDKYNKNKENDDNGQNTNHIVKHGIDRSREAPCLERIRFSFTLFLRFLINDLQGFHFYPFSLLTNDPFTRTAFIIYYKR